MKEPSEVPGTAMPDTKGGKINTYKETRGRKCWGGKQGGYRFGRVIPYSITPNLGWRSRGSHN